MSYDFSSFFNEKLKDAGLTVKQLSDTTGIATKYLEAFSAGRYDNLPSAPYLRGYLAKLGEALDFDPALWWERIQAEVDLSQSGARDTMPRNRFVREFPFSPWIIGIVVIAILFFGFRFSKILGAPALTIQFPEENVTQVSTPTARISGTAKNADGVFINGERVEIREDGSWEKEVVLQAGPNSLEISAKKTLGRETRIVRQIFYEPITALPAPTENPTSTPPQI